jgi:hypothetical protein
MGGDHVMTAPHSARSDKAINTDLEALYKTLEKTRELAAGSVLASLVFMNDLFAHDAVMPNAVGLARLEQALATRNTGTTRPSLLRAGPAGVARR